MRSLEIDGVSFSYPRAGAPALDGVDLRVEEGDFHGLLGPNGAGKTTLIHVLCGLLRPSAGRILTFGEDRTRLAARRFIGWCPQDLALYPTLTAAENLRLFGALAGVPGKELGVAVARGLDDVGLAAHARRRVEQFSGGMKRRLNLAVATVHRPRLLLLDEPTVGVDPHSRALIFDRLVSLNRTGTTVLYATHYMEEAERLCPRISIVDRGRVLLSEDREALLGDPEARIVVELDGELGDDLLDDVRREGLAPRRAGASTLEFSAAAPGRAAARIVLLASRRGRAIRRLETKRVTLEDRFLDLTGRQLRD